MVVTLIRVTQDAENLIELAARISRGSPIVVVKQADFLKRLIKAGHLSPLEHASATFLIEGISRICSHQIVRHRWAAYSQQSQRYCPKDKNVFPNWPPKHIEAGVVYQNALRAADKAYAELLALGVARDEARYVLSQATATDLILTMNFRSFRNFFEQRLSLAASSEIRELARRMFNLIVAIAPNVFEDMAKL